MARRRKAEREAYARPLGETLAVGRIVRPHGVRGGLLLEPYSDLVRSLVAGARVFLGEERRAATLAAVRPHGDRYLLELRGCSNREAAEAWRSAEVRMAAGEGGSLPPGTFFHWQILGLSVVTEQGEILGQVTEILDTGANDVYVVRGAREFLLPAIDEVVRQVDPAAGHMVVRLLPGLLD